MKTAKICEPFHISGPVGELADNVINNWLIGLRESNPAIIEMFRGKDLEPFRDLLPWSGEFAGKYITGAYYIYRLTGNKRLYHYILGFLDELLTCIEPDGYIGCFSEKCHLTGSYSQSPSVVGGTWDAWSHYHIMYGLFLWYKETKNEKLLASLEKIAGLFLRKFYGPGLRRLADIGMTEQNLAPLHIFALLYKETGKNEYLRFARNIEKDIASPKAGDYINFALKNGDFYRNPMPRWESLHILMGVAAMYDATGEERYRQATVQIFDSIMKTDIHNTGGFSTDERAIGTPYINGVIELCCTIAFNAFAFDVFRMTSRLDIIDYLELSYYNAIMGSFSPSGRWSTYNTPMDGVKEANYSSIGFQCRPGSPELNCCSANSARGIGALSDWIITEENNITHVNYFGPFQCCTESGLTIRSESDYPANGNIRLDFSTKKPQSIAIRIPGWSKATKTRLGGEEFSPVAGSYWSFPLPVGDTQVDLSFDMSPRILEGREGYAGKLCVYSGPVLFGADLSLSNNCSLDLLPPVSAAALGNSVLRRSETGKILLKIPNGPELCDFYRLGQTGSVYKTWLQAAK